jgi:hypothetical protein
MNDYTALFLIQALLHGILIGWLLQLWRRSAAPAALVLLVPEFGLVYDNLIVAAGRWIGLGPLLDALSWPRFWIHWLCGAWLIVASGSILRLAGIPFACARRGMLGFCLLTTALMALDLRLFWSASLHPVCELGLVRDSLSVAAGKFCLPGQQVVPSRFPLASFVTCLVVLGSGAALLLRRRFPWMLLGGAVMLATAAPPLKPLKLDNLGEVLITGGLVWAIARFAGPRRPLGAGGEPAGRRAPGGLGDAA